MMVIIVVFRFTEVTPMDIYIGVCFMYVVAALVEMAFVGYFDKPRYNRQPPSRRPPHPPVGSSAFGQIKHTSYLPIGITMATAAGQTTSDHNSVTFKLTFNELNLENY